MEPQTGTLQTLARHLVLAVQPLQRAVAGMDSFRTFMARLGWNVESLPPAYAALADKVDTALMTLEGLGTNPEPAAIFDLLDDVKALYEAVSGIGAAPAGVDAAEFLGGFAKKLFDLLLVDYLAAALPSVYASLEALEIIVERYVAATADRPGFMQAQLRWDEIPKVISDPLSIPRRVYGWGTDDLDFRRLAGHLLQIFTALDFPAYPGRVEHELSAGLQDIHEDTDEPLRRLIIPVLMDNIGGKEIDVGLALLELPAEGGNPAGLILQPLLPSVIETSHEITDNLRLELRSATDIGQALGVLLRPGDISVKFPFQPGTALPEAGFGVTLKYAPESPTPLLGTPGRSRLEIKGAQTSFNLDFCNGLLELRFEALPEELKLVIAASDLDGFLGQLLGRGEKSLPIALALHWSNRTGFSFMGGAGFEVSTHPHLSVGQLRIDRLDLAIKSTFNSGQPPDLKAEIGVTLAGDLGPVSFSAEGIGLNLSLVFAEGNAGPFDIQFGFKPPTGLGILVDAGPITGGGFLSFDKEKGRYAGALELGVFGTSVKAVGFVETKLPGGAGGYSFLILISTEFAPIQLGLGFTLDGVGGLAALHRGLDTEALQAGMRSGNLDNLLFPRNPIADAPRIVSELGVIFPPAQGRHVFGPLARIGWGTPTLIRAELGVILELPAPVRLTLLGLITAKLPSEDAAIVELHVTVLGRVDFARKLLAIDASLHDSNIAGFPITGDMALRLAWGEPPSFVLAIGGLNPHFEPPPEFRKLQPLTLILGTGDNPRLTCQAYLALTSNTLQFGVHAELYAAAAGFNLRGWISFDCLIQLSPFSLLAELSAEVAFRRNDHVLASVHLEASLTGPAPWHVWGEASISLLFFDVSVSFDATFGNERPQELPSANPWLPLQIAIQEARNWSTELPAGSFQAVTPAARQGPNVPVLIDPGGAATFRQTVLPLNRTITRFGAATPEGPDRYSLDMDSVTVNGNPGMDVTVVTDYFAAAQFEELSDTDKLSRPSFELMDAGISVAAGAVAVGPAIGASLEYESIILDAPWKPRLDPLRYHLPLGHQLAMLQKGAPARAPLKISGLSKFALAPDTPSKVALDDDLFVIANTADIGIHSGITGAVKKGAALAALASHLKTHPEDRGRLQVVPQLETVPTP